MIATIKAPKILLFGFSKPLFQAVDYFSAMLGWRVTADCSRAKCMEKARSGEYALALIDASKFREDGWRLFATLKRTAPNIPIIAVTSKQGGVEERLTAFEAGADDCVSKPFSCRELLYRMKGMLERAVEVREQAEIVRRRYSLLRSRLEIGRNGPFIRIAHFSVRLSSCEFKLIKYLADRSNRIVSREELLKAVWPTSSVSYCRTVDTNIKRIREKLKQLQPELAGIIRTERGRGYCLMDPAAETG
ncbi:response regulator transcription factor [Cohnella cellulosilytica]|uniref:Response regulator transcription factor n=2 Tax=Cohnella cellulosilytica TaxID=986710 RepID=A0ABW2FAP6_9BACL